MDKHHTWAIFCRILSIECQVSVDEEYLKEAMVKESLPGFEASSRQFWTGRTVQWNDQLLFLMTLFAHFHQYMARVQFSGASECVREDFWLQSGFHSTSETQRAHGCRVLQPHQNNHILPRGVAGRWSSRKHTPKVRRRLYMGGRLIVSRLEFNRGKRQVYILARTKHNQTQATVAQKLKRVWPNCGSH